jgi:JAB1/Mov34/MPN/PAD-1 ubiquitin protease
VVSPPCECGLTAGVFTVPFEEDDRDSKIWFLDHSYLEAMYGMFKKVNGAFYSGATSDFSLKLFVSWTPKQRES